MPDAADTLTLTEKQTHLGIYDPYSVGTVVDVGVKTEPEPTGTDAFTLSDNGAMAGTGKESSDAFTFDEGDNQVKYDYTDNTAVLSESPSITSTLSYTDSAVLTDSGAVAVSTYETASDDSAALGESLALAGSLTGSESYLISEAEDVWLGDFDSVDSADSGTLSAIESLLASLGSSDSATATDTGDTLKETGVHQYGVETYTLGESASITATLSDTQSVTLVYGTAAGVVGLTGTDLGKLTVEYGAYITPGTLSGLGVANTELMAELDGTPSVANRLEGDTDLIP